MRFDVVTIFPEYLAVLDVSLLGRARREGLVDVHVHDLRDFTFDRHRTVDDTPYGGGAGMVMKPEPGDGELRRQARGAVAHHEALPGGEAGVRVVGEDLHGHLAADAVRLADAGDADEVVLGCGTHGLSWVGRSVAGGGGAADDDGPPAR